MGIVPLGYRQILETEDVNEGEKLLESSVISNNRLTELLEQGFNPMVAARMQRRFENFRPVSERKRAPTPEEGLRIGQVEERTEGEDLAQNYSRRNPELDPQMLRRFVARFKGAKSVEEILDAVLDAVEDPTLADEVLEFLEQELEGNAKQLASDARNYLNTIKKREVIAGRNVDPAAKSFHKQGVGASPTELRNLYREITQEPKGHNALFTDLSKKYSFEEMSSVIAFLLKGIGYDLKSKGPSIQQPELMRLLTETRNLQSILWIYLFFKKRKKLIRRLYDEHGCEDEEPPPFEELAEDFISIVEERYPTVAKLLAKAQKRGLSDEEKLVIFMQYRDAIRGLAPRLYRNLKHRQDLLMIIIELLEELESEEIEEE
jgi:type III secretion system YopN/LcrE/InvE/MxiC family regulator